MTALWYSGYETWDVSSSDVLTSANFDWKQFNVNVTMSGLEEMQNNGKAAVFNWLKARIRVAEITAKNAVAAALFYSNTENGGKSIGGLQHLVADLPTSGTVGGIDRSANSWWRNQFYDFSTEVVTASSTTITHAMNEIYRRTQRGTDHVDFWVAGGTYFTYFEESMQPNQRFMSLPVVRPGSIATPIRAAMCSSMRTPTPPACTASTPIMCSCGRTSTRTS